jgi:hypothetical protein
VGVPGVIRDVEAVAISFGRRDVRLGDVASVGLCHPLQ